MNARKVSVLLTGATGGIGSSLLRLLVESNAQIYAVSRNPNALKALIAKCHYSEQQVSIIAADINSQAGRDRILSRLESTELPINMLINCAGRNQFSAYEKLSDKEIAQQVETNLLSPMLLTKMALPFLKKAGSAQIINVGSSFDSIGYPGFAAYNASKFGLRGFTEALRRELADTGIEVLLVSPRTTSTKMNSEKLEELNSVLGNRSDSAEVVAREIMQSIQRNQHENYIGWPEKLFARVNRVFPGIVDRSIRKQLATIKAYF